MPGPLLAIPLLFAQQPTPPAGGAGAGGPNFFFTMVLPLCLLFYLIVLRPQQQEQRRLRDQIKSLKKNDRVLTSAGIYGTVVSVSGEADRVVVRVDDEKGIKLEFTKASIARVIDPASEKEKGAEAAEGVKSR